MSIYLLPQLVFNQEERRPQATALIHKQESLNYAQLAIEIRGAAGLFLGLGLQPDDRVAVFLPKRPETVAAYYGTAHAGGCFVPINPLLKPLQVQHILLDSEARILVTSADRLELLRPILDACEGLRHVVLVDRVPGQGAEGRIPLHRWKRLPVNEVPKRIGADLCAILYTSGSTGHPKGVVLSHANMVAGARSVVECLRNTADDLLLAVLPFSFDYGLSQLSTAFSVGAGVVLMDYLLPRDVIRMAARHEVSGLAAVPPLWTKLAELDWPDELKRSLRYITSSGGAMPQKVLQKLRKQLPNTKVHLMYGLTEAFRSTWLPPQFIDEKPGSMGKAIPNTEILVVRPDGSLCEPGEHGELVHRGALVALGYWNDQAKTRQRFRPAPAQPAGLPQPEIAVWSGDTVYRDEDGFLYFVGRRDEMIKTSGYRVSPSEIEEVVYASHLVQEAVALGVPHERLGHAIVLVVAEAPVDRDKIAEHCRQMLPGFMQPQEIVVQQALPKNANGKFDRAALHAKYQGLFQESA